MNLRKYLFKNKNYFSDPRFLLILILIFALFLRLYFFVGMGFYDDSAYLSYASQIFKGTKWSPGDTFWGNRIAVYLPIVFFWKLFGISEISSSVYFILLSLGSILVTYFLGKEFFSENVGLVAAFLLSIFPLDIIYASQIGPDIPFMFFSSLFILLLVRANRYHSRLCAFFSGIVLILAYLTRGFVILLVPIIAIYFILDRKGLKEYFQKKYLLIFLCFLVGLFFMLGLENLYFYNSTGDWFYSFQQRVSAFEQGGNDNLDYTWYYDEMFNLESPMLKKTGLSQVTGWTIYNFLTPPFLDSLNYSPEVGFFQWIHDPPLFGFLYYFVTAAVIYFIYKLVRFRKKKDKYKLFFISWLLIIFLFLEYFLQIFCVHVVDYCVAARVPRFLIAMNVPAVILLSAFLFEIPLKGKLKKGAGFLIIVFLTLTSLHYAYQSHVFLRNGMGELRKASESIQKSELNDKKIYIPGGWARQKMQFFFEYNSTYNERMVEYRCGEINCSDSYYNSGKFIKNAFVVLWGTPYTLQTQNYPEFMRSPPENWRKVWKEDLKNYGIFNKYETQVRLVD